MTTNVAVLNSYLKAIDAHDADGVRSWFATDATVQAPEVSLAGVDAIAAWIGVFWRAFPDLSHQVLTGLGLLG
ncbi:MAG: nuclear transport factor 2 family protein [Dermatophilaceae bacterium]